jgi:hypothetical protein
MNAIGCIIADARDPWNTRRGVRRAEGLYPQGSSGGGRKA